MSKVWNDKLGYMMDTELNDKLDKKILGYQGKSGIAKDMREDEEEDDKYQVFDSAIMDAVLAAKDMYIEDGESLDKVITDLISWLKKCKGKEKEYLEMVSEEEDEEDDDDDEKEDKDSEDEEDKE